MIWDERVPKRLPANTFPRMHVTIDPDNKQLVKDKIHKAFVRGPKFISQRVQIGTEMVQVGSHQEQRGTETYQTGTRSVLLYEVLEITQESSTIILIKNKSSHTVSYECTGGYNNTIPAYGTACVHTRPASMWDIAYTEPIYGTRPKYVTVPDYEERPVYSDEEFIGLVMGIRRK